MSLKLFAFMFLLLDVKEISSIACQRTTPEQPPQKPQNRYQQMHLSTQWESCAALQEINHRMLALELQNAQFQRAKEDKWAMSEDRLERIDEQLRNANKQFDKDQFEKEMKRIEIGQENLKSFALQNSQHQKAMEDKWILHQQELEKIHEQLSNLHKNQLSEEIRRLEDHQEYLKNSIQNVFTRIDELERNLERLLDRLEVNFKATEERLVAEIVTLRAKEVQRPKNCKEAHEHSKISGVYGINVSSSLQNIDVYCDMVTRGGGWTYVLRRFDGSQDFQLTWNDYENGFGDPHGELWLGLEPLYQLTHSTNNELLVDMTDWNGAKAYARYKQFEIGSKKEGYPLKTTEGYSGNAGDGLSPLVDMKFTTLDKDQDISEFNCARDYKGAWWHKDCYIYNNGSKLTGLYLTNVEGSFSNYGIHWIPFRHDTLKEVRMMIKPQT